ncbi:MAG: hypothetical protein BM557_04930 [Flavobacterium sp. MedPE-SWcel]|nr:MAG: hypothetical protein BM557_04930 [Flavobacterium sp. MedPE-SWcel]
MKRTYLFLILCFTAYLANAQEPFITTWNVGSGLTIEIPIIDDDEIPDSYTVDFGDGTMLTNQSGVISHTYSNYGVYTVTISGTFSRISFGMNNTDHSNSRQLLTVEQWGDTEWTSMEDAFNGCENLTISATDSPDLSQVTSMSKMFQACYDLNSPLNNWDVSNVVDMSYTFRKANSFNQSLNNWDVSGVTSMVAMFWEAKSFNQPLSDWDVSNVTSMTAMFYGCLAFNQPLNSWDVSNVTSMGVMFWDANSFNQPLNNWDVSNVTSMGRMFSRAIVFNQPLNNWDVSNVTNMAGMFDSTADFNQPLSGWDVSNVTNMGNMFWQATSFNQPINNWDVSNVTIMGGTFYGCLSFNQPLNDWNVSNVTDMEAMFFVAESFNQPLDNWDVSNVITMGIMFYYTSALNQDFSSWSFNEDIIFESLIYPNYDYTFLGNSGLDAVNYDALLNRFVELGLENKEIGVEGLKYCDYETRDNLINNLGWTISGDGLGEECGNNNLSGTVLLDNDNDGCDADDTPSIHFIVNANDGSHDFATTTNDNGEYSLNIFENTYDITLLNVPNYFEVTPETSQITFTGSDNTEILNFCLTAIETIEDLNITLLPITDARPGFEAQYQLIVENMGTQVVSNATITLTFDEAIQTFLNATPEAIVTTANQLTFEVENLQPFASSIVDITMETFTPPTVNGGDIANFTATVTPSINDNTPEDNTFTLAQEVVNSYDPNDKRVIQGAEITLEQAEGYLDYIIRFQNTGTASAINVRVEDDLHENLDWTTFKVISASHDYHIEITDGNHVEFIFDDINLPHEDADAAASNGYIAYKIKPVADIAIGDIINGDAEIYFDYNLPIITNDAITEVVIPLSTDNHSINNQLSVYPNPVKDVVYIQSDNLTVEELTIYNLQGSQLITAKQNLEAINTTNLNTGIYLLHVQTNKGLAKYKLVKN